MSMLKMVRELSALSGSAVCVSESYFKITNLSKGINLFDNIDFYYCRTLFPEIRIK